MISKIIGKWKITEMELWNLDFVNAQGIGYFEFDNKNQGSFELISDDEIYGIICFHDGDESWVKAKKNQMIASKTCFLNKWKQSTISTNFILEADLSVAQEWMLYL